MSWNEYVVNLQNSGGVNKAAIMGQDGSCWAISEGWSISQAEVLAVVKGLADNKSFESDGVTVAGVRYIYLGGGDDFLRARKGKAGIHISKTKSALIFGLYEEPTQPGSCSAEVEKIADYLKNQQY